ncbi:MAG: GTPase domain-containing protein [Rubritalea sp.]|uniref:GTPase domain-containing protein n=1 Tax=Rubritalea sp. TaxID=2109375 RepID=UPI003242C664
MLGGEYAKTRDALIELIRYTRVLAKRSSTPLTEGEELLDDQLRRPLRFVVIGEDGVGKTSLVGSLTGVNYAGESLKSPSVSIIRNLAYRVFEDAEQACEKHYVRGVKGVEIVEVQDYGKLNDEQHASLDYLLERTDFLFWVFPAENPWSAVTWEAVEAKHAKVRMRSALVLQQSDRREAEDIPMLLGHMRELCQKRVDIAIPQFALSIHDGSGLSDCLAHVNLTLNRSVDRRRELRNVYKTTYEMLRRTEENIDDRSRNLAGEQEYLQSIEAQIDRSREEEVRHVMSNMSQLSLLLSSQIKRVMRFTRLRTGVVASHIALFGKGDTASKVEHFMIEKVCEEAESYARVETEKMRQQCRTKWGEMRPHLEDRLSIDVGDFNEASFDEQQELFCEGMTKSVSQAMLHLKLRRFLDVLVTRRYMIMRKVVKLALFLLTAGSLIGILTDKPLGIAALTLVGLGFAILAGSVIYSRRTGSLVNRSFAESLEDSVPALRKSLSGDYIDRVRAFYNGYTPMFESMRRHISDAKSELQPQQKVAAQLFLRLKALEQEI